MMTTALAPIALRDQLQEPCNTSQAAQGRERTERWGPRTLDLDILLYTAI